MATEQTPVETKYNQTIPEPPHQQRYHTTHLTSNTRLHLSHHLLLAGTTLSSLLEFTHVLPVTLALLLLGIDTASIERSGGCEGWPAERGGDESLCLYGRIELVDGEVTNKGISK
jgi:hypothetical protein